MDKKIVIIVRTIFALTVFSLCGMEENSGGSAGKSQSIFDVDALLATERPSWRQVTSADLWRIAEELDVPYEAVRDASLNYKKSARTLDTFRNASRGMILSQAEMYRQRKTTEGNTNKAKRNAWNAITVADKQRKAAEVGVPFKTVYKAALYYRINQRSIEVFQQASGQDLKEAASRYERNLQRWTQSRRDTQSAARRLLELQTSGEHS